jgi:hypothetical protein
MTAGQVLRCPLPRSLHRVLTINRLRHSLAPVSASQAKMLEYTVSRVI